MDTPVADGVLRRLHEAPSPRFERAGYRQTTRSDLTVVRIFKLWERQRRLKRLRTPGPTPPGLLRTYYDSFTFPPATAGGSSFAERVCWLSASRAGA